MSKLLRITLIKNLKYFKKDNSREQRECPLSKYIEKD